MFRSNFRFNGNGELTGSHFIAETAAPFVITNTFRVGAVSEGVLESRSFISYVFIFRFEFGIH